MQVGPEERAVNAGRIVLEPAGSEQSVETPEAIVVGILVTAHVVVVKRESGVQERVEDVAKLAMLKVGEMVELVLASELPGGLDFVVELSGNRTLVESASYGRVLSPGR